MNQYISGNTLYVIYSAEDIAELIRDKTGVPLENIKCNGNAELTIQLRQNREEKADER